MAYIVKTDRCPGVDCVERDITPLFVQECHKAGRVAMDIETTGLDWAVDGVRTIQLSDGGSHTAVVVVGERLPGNIRALLEDRSIQKIFHHALFDLRFLCFSTNTTPANIVCTKVAAKVLWPARDKHDLKGLLAELLDIHIDKSLRRSNWSSEQLTAEQIRYAANDVRYLPLLAERLLDMLRAAGKERIARGCFDHIPTRTYLDLGGYPDVFTY